MKKLIATLLVLALCIGCLAGCSKQSSDDAAKTNNTSSEGSKSESKTDSNSSTGSVEKVVILYPGEETDAMANFINNDLNPRLAADAGIELEIVYRGWDQYWEQKDIMLNASQNIDLYWDGLPDLAMMVNKHHCQPLDDLLKTYAPNVLAVYPEGQLAGGVVDGVQYGIPSAYAPSSCMFQLVCVRQDILEAVGMTEIKTAEDLKKFAELAKDQFPEMNGPADIIFKPLTRYFGDEQLTWCAYADSVVYGEDTNKAYSYFETDAFKKVAKFNESMYEAGLYRDELTTNYNERDSRMQQGTYLWVEGSLGKENEIINSVRANDPNAVLKTYLLKSDEPHYVTACGGEVLCIPYSAGNPAGAMKFLNWMYASQENYLFCLYGKEGENYTVENGRIALADPTFEGFFYEWMFRNANYTMFTTDIADEYIERFNTWDDGAKTSDVIAFHFDNANVKEIEASVTEIINQYFTPIECGFVSFDDNYDDAVAKLKDAGIDEYVAGVQRQLDEFFAVNGYNN